MRLEIDFFNVESWFNAHTQELIINRPNSRANLRISSGTKHDILCSFTEANLTSCLNETTSSFSDSFYS